MTSMADDIAWTRRLAVRLGPRVKSSMRWSVLKGLFRGNSSPDNAKKLAQTLVDVAREEAEDEESKLPFALESHLVMSLKAVLEANNVPSDVAERIIRQIEEWEKTPTAQSWI